MTQIIQSMIKFLKEKNLSHAAITLAVMLIFGWRYPWVVSSFMVGAYYGREVTDCQNKGLVSPIASLWPLSWPTAHDRWQTLWVVVVAYGVAAIQAWILAQSGL